MSIYEEFGVQPIINGVGPATRLGGTIMDDEVLAAMADAARHYVKIDELQDAAGRFIAEADRSGIWLRNVRSGGRPGAGGRGLHDRSRSRENQPAPNTAEMKNEIVIHRTHRYDYDHALQVSGRDAGRVWFPGCGPPYALESTISENTAAVAYYPTPNRVALPLPMWSRLPIAMTCR